MSELLESANACVENREDIPKAPLWHLGKIATFGSKDSYKLIQNTVDYLTCKAQLSLAFNKDEKIFMKELFEAFWWGGNYHGFHEAAKLSSHYVNGDGKPIKIKSTPYESSIIVQDAMTSLNQYIYDLAEAGKPFAKVKTTDRQFINSIHSKGLFKDKRSISRQGYMFPTGILIAEQSNLQLKKADHQFILQAHSKKQGKSFITRYEVKSLYDFEPFEKNNISYIPLNEIFTLQLPDGLSYYLTKIGVAKEFYYSASWQKVWG